MTNNQVAAKDPADILDYRWNFAPETVDGDTALGDWLAEAETIVDHAITTPSGLTLDSSSITDDGKTVTAWFSGGTANVSYRPTCHIVTSAGRELDRSMTIRVREL